VVRIYTYRSHDPQYLAGIQFLAVGRGSLWFLEWRPGGVLAVWALAGQSAWPATSGPVASSAADLLQPERDAGADPGPADPD